MTEIYLNEKRSLFFNVHLTSDAKKNVKDPKESRNFQLSVIRQKYLEEPEKDHFVVGDFNTDVDFKSEKPKEFLEICGEHHDVWRYLKDEPGHTVDVDRNSFCFTTFPREKSQEVTDVTKEKGNSKRLDYIWVNRDSNFKPSQVELLGTDFISISEKPDLQLSPVSGFYYFRFFLNFCSISLIFTILQLHDSQIILEYVQRYYFLAQP